MDCLFCKIVNGEMPALKLYEDDFCIAMLDLYPNVNGHTLIIPKDHYEDFTEIPDSVLTHIHKVAKGLRKELMEKLDCKSLTLLVNYGDDQKIKHYHLHLLPDYSNQNQELKKPEEIYDILTKEK